MSKYFQNINLIQDTWVKSMTQSIQSIFDPTVGWQNNQIVCFYNPAVLTV